MIGVDPHLDLVGGQAALPDIARIADPARHEPQPAAQFGRLRMADRDRAVVQPRIAFVLGAIEVDPGAGALRHEQRLGAAGIEAQRVGIAVLESLERRERYADRGPERQRIVAPRMRHGENNRGERFGGAMAHEGRR